MKRPSLGAIFLTVFLDLLGFGLVMPFLGEEARDTFSTTTFVATLLGSVYSLMQFLFVPLWGRLSDRIGRRPVLLWSTFASAFSMAGLGLGLAYGQTVLWLFVARSLSGIATANLGTASAYIADITAPEDRARGMGLIGMAFGLGFILGPAAGGMLSSFTVHGRHGVLVCFVAASLSLLNGVWVLLGLVESLPPSRRAPARTGGWIPLRGAATKEILAVPSLAIAVAVNVVIVLSFTTLDQTFRFFNKDLFGMTQQETGWVFAFLGIMGALVQGVWMRPLTARFPGKTLVRSGVFLQAAGFALLALSPSIGTWMLFAAGGVLAVGNALTQANIPALISNGVRGDEQGKALGTNQAMASLARMFGPALGGYFYGTFGPRVPYLVATLGMLGAFWLARGLQGGMPAASRTEPLDTSL